MTLDPNAIDQLKVLLKTDPRLANPSAAIRAFAAFLNDRQPDSEKSTPETEWRRMRDIWGALNLLGKALTAITRDLEKNSQVNVTIQEQLGSVSEPSTDPYDPMYVNPNYGGGAGSGFQNMSNAVRNIRSAISDATQIALECRGMIELYTSAVHGIAEQVTQLGADAKARMDSLVVGGGGDHGALTGLTDDDHPQYLLTDGSRILTGDFNAGTNQLTNLGAPVAGTDAATKDYVDSLVGITDHGLLTGLLDDDHPQYLRTDGTRALTGNQSAGVNKITSLADGVAAADAVNKGQMDAGDALAIAKSLLTTKGDLISRNTTVPVRHAIGANGTTIIANSANADGWMNGDHGNLGGLADDDHTQYTKADGTRAFTGDQSMGGNQLTNVGAPGAGGDAANQTYVDAGDALAIPKSTMNAKGDLLGASANDTPIPVTVGADDEVLVADSGTIAGIDWKTLAQVLEDAILTTAGDILINNGTNVVRLAAGSPGQVLTINGSGIPVWATP